MSIGKVTRLSLLPVSIFFCIALPTPAYAHGFGERYDLPIPFGTYIFGAVSTVVLSFVIVAWVTQKGLIDRYPRKNISNWPLINLIASRWFIRLMQIVSLFAFFLVVTAGFIGNADPNQNIAPTFIWIIFWVGMVFISGFVGNIWQLLCPWVVLYEVIEFSYKIVSNRKLTRNVAYPKSLGSYPAVLTFFIFAWIENVWVNVSDPFALSVIICFYSLFTLIGMFYFGPNIWLKNCEIFSITMQFFAKLAPFEALPTSDSQEVNNEVDYRYRRRSIINIRVWGSGLLSKQKSKPSEGIFLILLLSTVSFDGFAETDLWSKFVAVSYDSFAWLGVYAFSGIKTFGLITAPVLLGAAFASAIWVGRRLAGVQTPLADLITQFSISLMPIAFAYHVAHYFSYLLIQGQRIIALISDPFGWGWNIIGTANYSPDISIVDAELAWAVGLCSIVVGHVIAVYSSHVIASKTFGSLAETLRSQVPMMVLMVGYTVLSLWIIAQPIVSH